MPKHLKNDRIFQRPLIWLVVLGFGGMAAASFLPAEFFSDLFPEPEINPPPPAYRTPAPDDTPPAPPEPVIPAPPAEGKFVKGYLEFHDSKDFYNTISASGINPTLITQLTPLQKRLHDPKLSGVDLLYADYVKDDQSDPQNSKIIAVRLHYGIESQIYFGKMNLQMHNKTLLFYDEQGNAPELALDRIPLTAYERITSPFNPHRLHPITHQIRPHYGTDFKAPYGTPVHSTGKGVVAFAGWQRGYGKVVIIDHAGNYQSRYAHLSAIETNAGAVVTRGQEIGKLGNTGASTGAHLHYEIRHNGTPFDPMTIELPSERPLPASYMNAWHYRCAQYQKAMDEIATTGKTNL